MVENYDVVVIGSGPGGYVAAIRAAQLGLKTACIEKNQSLGGTCLNVGCIPSKCLLQSSELYYKMLHDGKAHGIEVNPILNFDQMMRRKQDVVSNFNSGIQSLFKKNTVTQISGLATFKSPHSVLVDNREIHGKHFILATGSVPTSLPFMPFDEKQVFSSTGILELKKIPESMVVIGAGIIGVELGSVYSRLGTKVHFIEFLDRICPTLDESLSKGLEKILKNQGLTFQLSSRVTAAHAGGSKITLSIEGSNQVEAELALVSVGRKPYIEGLGIENIGIQTDTKGFIPIDSNFRTIHSHIYAIGDIVDGPMLAHKASEEGYAVAEMIGGNAPHIEYIAIPSVVYTDPEVGAVGLSEKEAREKNLDIKIAQFPLKANSRASCSGNQEGFVKIIADVQTGVILGVHILSSHAGELIATATLAIEKRTTAAELASTCHAHPTLSEALKEVALILTKEKPIHL